jgi:hypothetical protein
MTPNITRQQLDGYLDDMLSASETAQVEQALRESEALRRKLRALIQERDRGDHSIGAVWRREHLSCPTREQLGTYVTCKGIDEELEEYIDFHLKTIGCAYCNANHDDLEAQWKAGQERAKEQAKAQARRRRYLEHTTGYLKVGREAKG